MIQSSFHDARCIIRTLKISYSHTGRKMPLAKKNLASLPVIHMKSADGEEGVRLLTSEERENYEPPDEALEAFARYLYPIIRAHFMDEKK